MIKKLAVVLVAAALALAFSIPVAAKNNAAPPKGGRNNVGYIYVTSQNLLYATFVTVDPLPWTGSNMGSFQQLYDGMTDYGPGDPGYRGGRWWVDTNGNGYQDEEDHFFICPLLPPGIPPPD